MQRHYYPPLQSGLRPAGFAPFSGGGKTKEFAVFLGDVKSAVCGGHAVEDGLRIELVLCQPCTVLCGYDPDEAAAS